MNRPKRALAVHDISCVGKCSLTIALPILSAAGIETSILPTSVLSTHTGGFGAPVFHDLTEELTPIASHWNSFGFTVDAIYTGYLGSPAQVNRVLALFDDFGDGALKLVDPVMADNGKLYSGISPDFTEEVKKLCDRADIIVPNLTEAALLLDEPYVAGPYTEEYITGVLSRLSDRYPGSIVLTGVQFDNDNLGAAAYDRTSASVVLAPRIPGHFHGTGDIFASALLSALLNDKPLNEAIQIAVGFTSESIRRTDPEGDRRYGVRFEAALPSLMHELNLI